MRSVMPDAHVHYNCASFRAEGPLAVGRVVLGHILGCIAPMTARNKQSWPSLLIEIHHRKIYLDDRGR